MSCNGMTRTLSNISLKDFRDFLIYVGCTKTGVKGGHEKWKKKGCTRSIVFQTHKDPIPRHVVYSNLLTLGLTRDDFELWLSCNKPKKQ